MEDVELTLSYHHSMSGEVKGGHLLSILSPVAVQLIAIITIDVEQWVGRWIVEGMELTNPHSFVTLGVVGLAFIKDYISWLHQRVTSSLRNHHSDIINLGVSVHCSGELIRFSLDHHTDILAWVFQHHLGCLLVQLHHGIYILHELLKSEE